MSSNCTGNVTVQAWYLLVELISLRRLDLPFFTFHHFLSKNVSVIIRIIWTMMMSEVDVTPDASRHVPTAKAIVQPTADIKEASVITMPTDDAVVSPAGQSIGDLWEVL
jgi:hypothetical protein